MPRIAVLRALQLGDLLVAVPALRALRRRFPDAEVTLIGLPWARDFVSRFSRYLDAFLEFPGWPGIPEAPVDRERIADFLAAQRLRPFDLAIQLHGSGGDSNRFVRALGARTAVGWYDERGRAGLDLEQPYPAELHEIDRNLRLVGLLGADTTDRRLELPISAPERAATAELLAGLRRPLIGIHAGARWRERRWPAARFASLASTLVRRAGGTVVLTGSRREGRLARAIAARVDGPARVVAGRTSLGELAALVASLDVLVTNDTGTSHVAVATETPSVVVWGTANERRWAPLERARHAVVASASGIRGVGVDAVLAAAMRLLHVRAAA